MQLTGKSLFALLQISVCSSRASSQSKSRIGTDLGTVNPFGIPAIITTQSEQKYGPCVPSIKQRVAENTPQFEKSTFSMLTKDVVDTLKQEERDHVVLVGVEAHICVAQTAFGT